ncbi:hypothetical protein, partial [Staphylococcus epidermidis]|uniref:hypothetical protein n=1 Tax=Staphylococcus epidermidis TaxID=1282 RepID=UPI0037DA56E7
MKHIHSNNQLTSTQPQHPKPQIQTFKKQPIHKLNHSKSIKHIQTLKPTHFKQIHQFHPKPFTLNKPK